MPYQMNKLDKSQSENEAGEAKGATPFSFCSKNNLKKKMLSLLLLFVIFFYKYHFSIIIVTMIIAKHEETALIHSKTCYFKIP